MNEIKAIKLRRKLSESEKTVEALRKMLRDQIDKNIELEVKIQRMRIQIGEGNNVKRILDASCGSRMFWFNKQNEDVLFMDNRELSDTLCDGRKLEIKPDTVADFRDMPFEDESFYLVVFDPPHLIKAGENSWLAKKYGKLDQKNWQEDISQGFNECMSPQTKRNTHF